LQELKWHTERVLNGNHYFHKHLLVRLSGFFSLYLVAKALSAVIAAIPTNVAAITVTIAIKVKEAKGGGRSEMRTR
jgi:hypothetical protein